VRADTATTAEYVLKAIDMLLSVHGAGSFAETNPLQRIWRDANTAARHGVVNPLVSYEVYGKALLGDERPVVSPLV
jgi:alkylation response protein AidB-like acyl-CoA dehydrogenase